MPATLTPQTFVARWRKAARELVQLRDASGVGAPGGSPLTARTLTNLYNARPTWPDNEHRKLNMAVFAAYGWTSAHRQAQGKICPTRKSCHGGWR